MFLLFFNLILCIEDFLETLVTSDDMNGSGPYNDNDDDNDLKMKSEKKGETKKTSLI